MPKQLCPLQLMLVMLGMPVMRDAEAPGRYPKASDNHTRADDAGLLVMLCVMQEMLAGDVGFCFVCIWQAFLFVCMLFAFGETGSHSFV